MDRHVTLSMAKFELPVAFRSVPELQLSPDGTDRQTDRVQCGTGYPVGGPYNTL